MQRGEIWWANLPPPSGRRPVVLVSRERAIQTRRSIVVAVVTGAIRQLPVEVRLGPEDGLSKECVVNVDVLHTVPKAWLMNRITTLGSEKMEAVNTALRFALGLD
ncbi:MAG: type II toxin-antitoxin system PemK/MazF family toxin [Nitrospirae bacterium]|nr:type II toxin-antitoxin system PemK/MazF family toxin [Nitrospirota bacterium]